MAKEDHSITRLLLFHLYLKSCRLTKWDAGRDIMGPRGHEDRCSYVAHLRLILLEVILVHYIRIATPEKNLSAPLC